MSYRMMRNMFMLFFYFINHLVVLLTRERRKSSVIERECIIGDHHNHLPLKEELMILWQLTITFWRFLALSVSPTLLKIFSKSSSNFTVKSGKTKEEKGGEEIP